MNVRIISKSLSKRDADFSEISEIDDVTEKPLAHYTTRMELTLSKQKGHYRSIQGATITPQPFWCIEFDTVEKKFRDTGIIQPRKQQGSHVAMTARWAKDVEGTGQQKQKWRNSRMYGPVSPSSVFSVISSNGVVPFAIIHRYIAFIPATVSSEKKDAKLILLDNVARDNRMDAWMDSIDVKNNNVVKWVKDAQQKWSSIKTSKSFPLVTERLNYHGTLVKQTPKSVRVVHSRSRFLKAAVLDPYGKTSTDLPINNAILKTRAGILIQDICSVPVTGTIVDNMLHWITVESRDEAYWLSGLFNSNCFQALVIEESGGPRGSEYVPSIYSIPVKILAKKNIIFNPSNSIHQNISQIAKLLEEKMTIVARNYLSQEKNIPLDRIDDTVQSPIVPDANAGVYLKRLSKVYKNKISELNYLVESIL